MRFIFIFSCLLATARAEDLQWFKSEYLPVAEKLERAYDHCTAMTTTIVTNDKNSDSVKTTYFFAFDGDNLKWDRDIETRNAEGSRTWSRTLVGTPNLSFMILTRDGKKLLEKVDRSARGLDFMKEQMQSDIFLAAFSFFGRPISKRLTDKHFIVKSIRREGDSVRLDYKFSESDMTCEGWLTFNKEWLIDRWEVFLTRNSQPPDSWRRTGEAHYNGTSIESVKQLIYDSDRIDTEQTIVSDLKFGPVPASQFMLSHYGYDDRIATGAGRISLPFWLALFGGMFLMLAFALRMYRRKS